LWISGFALAMLAPLVVCAQQPAPFRLGSPAFGMGTAIPKRFGYRAGNYSPPLVISSIPEGTKSLALIVDDPDSPSGNWTHWLLANIPPKTKAISEAQAPQEAIIGRNSFGNTKYDGPSPPGGTHRYYFHLFALDTTLSLKTGFNRKDLEAAMKNHIIAQAETMGTYSAAY